MISQLSQSIDTAAVDAGQFAAVAAQARRLHDRQIGESALALPLARLARIAEQTGAGSDASELYQRSISVLDRHDCQQISLRTQFVLRLAAARSLIRNQEAAAAIDSIAPVVKDTSVELPERQRRLAISICLSSASAALSDHDFETARRAYELVLEHGGPDDQPAAILGDAWMSKLSDEQPEAAIEKLTEFCRRYPDHPNAGRAASAAVESLQRTSQELRIEAIPPALKDWLLETYALQPAAATSSPSVDQLLLPIALVLAAQSNDQDAWQPLSDRIQQQPAAGRIVSAALAHLSPSDAQRLAASLVANPETDPAAREIAARWAGANQHWAMLASAAENTSPTDKIVERSAVIERLYAESLMQLGRVSESKPWWDHLVDHRATKDFSILLRCAEVETTVGDDAGLANRRISAARQAAGEDPAQLAMVDLLAAELSIRRTEFDQARATLENSVRAPGANASVRARAQWLIGETYYLQRNFSSAIDAYRAVEGIAGPDQHASEWTAAALVQAAKSFEQLGRTREAVLCYGNLLQRFPHSDHTRLARRRMAALDSHQPTEPPSNGRDGIHDSSPTIRR